MDRSKIKDMTADELKAYNAERKRRWRQKRKDAAAAPETAVQALSDSVALKKERHAAAQRRFRLNHGGAERAAQEWFQQARAEYIEGRVNDGATYTDIGYEDGDSVIWRRIKKRLDVYQQRRLFKCTRFEPW